MTPENAVADCELYKNTNIFSHTDQVWYQNILLFMQLYTEVVTYRFGDDSFDGMVHLVAL